MKAGETNEMAKDIAKRRAESAMQVLVEAGIDKNRVIVKIHDDAEAATTETSEAGKAKNRRVEFNAQK